MNLPSDFTELNPLIKRLYYELSDHVAICIEEPSLSNKWSVKKSYDLFIERYELRYGTKKLINCLKIDIENKIEVLNHKKRT